jgi:hypothetical protein
LGEIEENSPPYLKVDYYELAPLAVPCCDDYRHVWVLIVTMG